MRILFVSQFYYPEPFRVHEIAEELVRLGNTVTVVTTFPNYPQGTLYDGYSGGRVLTEVRNGVMVIRVPSRTRGKNKITLALSYFSFYRKARWYLKKHLRGEFDVVYCYQMSPVLQAIPAVDYAKRNRIPFFLYCLDIWPESICDVFSERSLFYRLVRRVSAKIYRAADRIGVTSPSFAGYLQRVCGVHPEKLIYLPQHADDVANGSLLDTLPSDTVNLVFTGNVGEIQNMDEIVDAVKLLGASSPVRVHIVGAGSALERTQKRVQTEQLQDRILFYGKRPYQEMVEFYRMADACLLTLSNRTQTGLTIPGKLQGYMAAGKPIVASINGDAADVLAAAECGICVPADDAAALAEAMREFAEHPQKYRDCGARARAYYEAHFTLKRHTESLQKQLCEMVGKHENTDDQC